MSNVRRVGAYAKLLANYAADDAVMAAGEAAELLFVRGIAFCSTSDSDGYITDAQLTRYVGAGMKDVTKRAHRLVEVGLWVHEDGGYQVRSWVKIHPTTAERGRQLKTDRERKARDRGVVQEPVRSESERTPSGQETDSAAESLSLIQSNAQQSIAQRTESAPRKDELFEAVAEVCGIKLVDITKASRGALNNAVGQLRSVEASPNQVRVRANRYRQRYPDTSLTPSALVKHWPALAEQRGTRQVGGGW